MEAIGSDDPAVDAETIVLLAEILEAIKARDLRLRLSSLGTPDTRAEYKAELQGYLREHEGELSQEVRDRIDLNPLRAFDADHPGTRQVMAGAPLLLDRLNDEDREHFETVKALLDAAGLAYEVDPGLVRGLDYYTRTVFEFTSDALGSQSGVGGGGRYDGLIEQLGGAQTPGMGWAAGVERMLLASDPPPTAPPPLDLYVAYAKPEYRERRLPAGRRRPPRRPRRAARARRPQPQGPAQAGGPREGPVRCHPRRRGYGAEGHGIRRAAHRGDRHRDAPHPPMRPPRANTYRDAWAGELDATRVGEHRPRGRLGPPPPRPRRPGVHRPARPLGHPAARLPPRGLAEGARARPAAALRARDQRLRRDRPARGGQGEPAS